MFDERHCGTCACSSPNLTVETGRACNLLQIAVKDDDYCSHYQKEPQICDCCGGQYFGKGYIIMSADEDGTISKIDGILCHQCNAHMNECVTCVNRTECAFENDPSPLPKVVQQEIRQGNMVAVTQVMNPERVRITCQNGCQCYSDFSCLKHIHGTCSQYQMNRA